MARARPIPGLAGDSTFGAAAAMVVAVRAAEVFERAEGVLDTGDIERVHAMRVATRRLRAVLEIFRPCFPAKRHAKVLRDVKQLANALGERRDPDVALAALASFRSQEPAGDGDGRGLGRLEAELRGDQAAGNEELADVLRLIEASDLRGRLEELVARVKS